MPEHFVVMVNGRQLMVKPGTTAAAALAIAGSPRCRTSVSGEPRAPLCGMGVCFECRANVDGVPHVKTCQTVCEPGMTISSDAM